MRPSAAPPPSDHSSLFLELRDFRRSLTKLRQMGGPPRRRSEKVFSILGLVAAGESRPFRDLKLTKHGESRIRGCRKYDLGDGYRLITVIDGIYCLFCFVGKHDDCDKWLMINSGLRVNADKHNTLSIVYQSGETVENLIRREPAPSPGTILTRLSEEYQNELLEDFSPVIIGRLHALDDMATDQDIARVTETIMDIDKRQLIYDVMCLLLCGDISSAENRIDFHKNRNRNLSLLSEQEFFDIRDGDTVRRVVIGSSEYKKELERISRDLPYHDWLLFMHPEQQNAVDEDFSGTAQLSGVSGSGKTCVAVRRAVRLAEQNSTGRVLILTLNRSLAFLIDRLINHTAPEDIIHRIKVSSFFELCQDLMNTFEPHNYKLYTDVAWKLEDHVDEVFREYYRCWLNNNAASVLLPIHSSLTARGVAAETYIREEFDWIRGTILGERRNYLTVERVGRRFPLSQEWRTLLLRGLEGWERKMEAVGVIDYLGLTTAVARHMDDIQPHYDHVLVDEAQDFGTTELAIIRKLVPEGQNDIFLCGDIAQHVLPKHRNLQEAGLDVTGKTRTIRRNYRNSREILQAAHDVFFQNLDDTIFDSEDLELLDPELASRSSPRPGILRAQDLGEEIIYARSLIADHLEYRPEDKCCIAIAGYSMREVELFGESIGVKVLDGRSATDIDAIVLSDLEQTKGYEFNLVIILNCGEEVIPPADALEEERFRHGCRLYVAMTRAKDELYLSYSGGPSKWLDATKDRFGFMAWSQVVEKRAEFPTVVPDRIGEVESGGEEDIRSLTGRQFVYTSAGVGLSVDAQRRVVELVRGNEVRRDGRAVSWRNIGALAEDLERFPRTRAFVGRSVQRELRWAFNRVFEQRMPSSEGLGRGAE